MKDNEYWLTGTSLECWRQIVKSGFILRKPPERVWENYSSDFVYMVAYDPENDCGGDDPLIDIIDQASVAVWKFNHTKRVIVLLEGLNSSVMDQDPDGEAIHALRYPFDVPMANVAGVYLEKRNNHRQLKQYNAITRYWEKLRNSEAEALDEWKIPHLDSVPKNTLFDRSELENYYLDLREAMVNKELFEFSPLQKHLRNAV